MCFLIGTFWKTVLLQLLLHWLHCLKHITVKACGSCAWLAGFVVLISAERTPKLILAIAEFVNGAGAEAVAKLQRALPRLEAALQQCCIVPFRHSGRELASLHAVPDAATISSAAITKAAAGTDPHNGAQLNRCLDAYWVHRHRPVADEDWQGPLPQSIPSGETVCSKAGHCLCSPEGRQLLRLKDSLYDLLKECCPAETAERALAREGYLVLRLRSMPEQPFFGDDSDGDEALEEDNRWWHLSKLMLTPYLPVFTDMVTPAFTEGDPVPLDEEIALQAGLFVCLS